MHPIADRAIHGSEPIADLVAEFYGPGGPLAAAGWQVRPQQQEMSLDIARAYDDRKAAGRGARWTVHEAPCGTGKGLAYLVPGALIALRERALWQAEPPDKRAEQAPQALVSTANIALQEQLVTKDIPALADMLGVDLRVALLKGRNNYLCRQEIAAVTADLAGDHRFARLCREIENGWDGDRESLSWDPGNLWPKVSRTSDQCPGRGCHHYALTADVPVCYWRQATRGLAQAHIVVVNHHMLALKGGIRAAVLAVDEMHELESCIRSAVSGQITRGTGVALARRAAQVLGDDEARVLVQDPVNSLMSAIEHRFERANPRRVRYPDPVVLGPGWMDAPERLSEAVEQAYDAVRVHALRLGCYEAGEGQIEPPSAKAEGDTERVREASACAITANALYRLATRVYTLATGTPHHSWPGAPWALYGEGFWTEDGRLQLMAKFAPADVSWAVTALQNRYPVAAMTSATVPAFESLRLTFGMPAGQDREDGGAYPWVVEKRLPSPYDLPNQGVLVIPRGPSPKDAEWATWAAQQVVDLVQAAKGRTLVLASSVAQMRRYGEALRRHTAYDVRVQGEEGRATLRAWFRDHVDGVLVATRSFFQGLDVQGESCSLVIIDRIPFARPGDPVEDAVQRLLVERAGGGSGYLLRSVPDAAMVLAQGAGRLIRSSEDRGAVAVLDNRLTISSGAWKTLRDALPPFPMSYEVDDVAAMLEGRPIKGLPIVRARTVQLRWA